MISSVLTKGLAQILCEKHFFLLKIKTTFWGLKTKPNQIFPELVLEQTLTVLPRLALIQYSLVSISHVL